MFYVQDFRGTKFQVENFFQKIVPVRFLLPLDSYFLNLQIGFGSNKYFHSTLILRIFSNSAENELNFKASDVVSIIALLLDLVVQ